MEVRAKRLTRISNLSQAIGQMSSPGLVAARDALLTWTPQSWVKGPLFDLFIRLSLAR